MLEIDLPPWLQTVLFALTVLLVAAHEVGLYLLKQDPRSDLGRRLVMVGLGLRWIGRTPAGRFLPGPVRAALESIPEPAPAPPSDPPRVPPLLALAALGLVACSNLNQAKTGANALKGALLEAAEPLRAMCVDPYLGDHTPEERDRLRSQYLRSGCPRFLTAYDTAKRARESMLAVIAATEAGQCVNASRTVDECDVFGAYADVVSSSVELARAMRSAEAAQ
jgi:hypothetical protein